MKFDMSDFMAFFGSGGALLPQDKLILRGEIATPATTRGCERQVCWCHGIWREATIRARSLSKATEIKEAYFTYGRGESLLEAPSRASCGMFWVDSLTETQERVRCVISAHSAGALACTRLTYPLKPSSSTRKLKPRIHGRKPNFSDAALERSERSERAPEPGSEKFGRRRFALESARGAQRVSAS